MDQRVFGFARALWETIRCALKLNSAVLVIYQLYSASLCGVKLVGRRKKNGELMEMLSLNETLDKI